MIKYFNLSLLLLLTCTLFGCAGNVRLKLEDCNISELQMTPTNKGLEFDSSFTAKIWSFGIYSDSVTDIFLKDVLKEKSISCVNIKYIRYTIAQSIWDQIFSIVPFIQRSSLKLEVIKAEDAVGF